mmetsp:Transcript_1344/g.3070  ORF Transcript_1344/g.3070 Transcript_1344/m.3070 type:complete len:167 (-) Transcript_1344:343-843(-)|eukprot:g1663.t1
MADKPKSSEEVCKEWLAGHCNNEELQAPLAQEDGGAASTSLSEQEILSRLRVANLMLSHPIKEQDIMKLQGLPSVESWVSHPVPKGAVAVAGPRGHICFIYGDEQPTFAVPCTDEQTDPKAPAFEAPAKAAEAKQLARLSFVSRTFVKPEKRLTEEQLKGKVARSE